MSTRRVHRTSHPRLSNSRFAWAAAVLATGCSFSLAQNTTSANPSPVPPQSSSVAVPSQTQAATPANIKPRKLNCQHPARPGKRRFGCKDEDFDWEETLTSRWKDDRAKLKELGITPSGSYFSALQTNVSGGPHPIWAYTGQLTAAVDVNFEKVVSGLTLYVSGSWGTGSNLSAAIDTVYPVNIDYALGAYLGEMYLQKKLLNGDLTFAAGRLAASYTFAELPVFDNYVSSAINPTPVSLISNDLSYTGPPPGLEWGGQAIWNVTPVVQVAAGVFNTNPNSATNGNVLAFQQNNKGALVTAQASYLRNQGSNDKGKPGQYTAGFFADNNTFATLPSGNSLSDGNSGIFVLGQQMVYQAGGEGSAQGLTIWAAFSYSSKQLVSSMPVFGGAGLSYQGLIKKRTRDTVNLGWVYGKTSSYIPNAAAAKLLEANYQWVARRYVTVVLPDFQYIWNVNGTKGPAACVVGVQVNVTF